MARHGLLAAAVAVLLALFSTKSPEVEALSCLPCGTTPCEAPACCDSGAYTKDVCGCCNVCAKSEGEACGGPWNTSGRCKNEHSCFRECGACTTLNTNKSCVFPFSYQV